MQGTGVSVSQVVTTGQQDSQDVQSVLTMNTQGQASQRADAESAGSAMTRRRLMAIQSGVRMPVITARSIMQVHQVLGSGTCKLDSHADTCVAGPNCIIEHTGYTLNVSGFSNKQDSIRDVPIVKAATAYDDSKTGATYILILGQAIYMGEDVVHTLLCPNQLRYNGVVVDECPKHLAPKNKPCTHAIHVPEQGVTIPLKMSGTMSVFETRTPSQEELESCMWVSLTGDEVWDPRSDHFSTEEEKLEYHEDDIFKCRDRQLMTLTRNLMHISEAFDDSAVLKTARSIRVVSSSQHKPVITGELLSKRWGIGLDMAFKTIQVTTQQGIRNVTGPLEGLY
jgi:hypothetical protein